MQDHIERYWKQKLEKCRKSLEKNNFDAFIADSCEDAKRIVLDEILPHIRVKTVSWGDSLTFHATEILDDIRQNPDMKVI